MFGNFIYSNPTKLIFGEDSINYLKDELKKIWSKSHVNLWWWIN